MVYLSVGRDQLCLIKIDGMHCHKCEELIQRTLSKVEGVNEAEVDFNCGLASVLFDPAITRAFQLINAVVAAGYQVIGFTQHCADPVA